MAGRSSLSVHVCSTSGGEVASFSAFESQLACDALGPSGMTEPTLRDVFLGLDQRGLAVFASTFLDSIHEITRLRLDCFLSDVKPPGERGPAGPAPHRSRGGHGATQAPEPSAWGLS